MGMIAELSDVVLPGGMNGIDISHLIRKQLPNLKYLFMSGYNSFPVDLVRRGMEKEMTWSVNVKRHPFGSRSLGNKREL